MFSSQYVPYAIGVVGNDLDASYDIRGRIEKYLKFPSSRDVPRDISDLLESLASVYYRAEKPVAKFILSIVKYCGILKIQLKIFHLYFLQIIIFIPHVLLLLLFHMIL